MSGYDGQYLKQSRMRTRRTSATDSSFRLIPEMVIWPANPRKNADFDLPLDEAW
jgi:hypothetical protein